MGATHIFQKEVRMKKNWQAGQNSLFFCYVRILISTEVQVLWHVDRKLWAFTALHPPAVGWAITLPTQPSRAENCVAATLLSRRGNPAASPCCKQMVQKEKKGKKKVPPGRVCCFHRAGESRERLDYNPCCVFISALFTKCCSPWLSCLLSTAARFTIPPPGKTLPPCKASP